MCNSSATFQAFMDDLFRDYITEGWLVIYMDNLLIHSLNQEIHNECTQKVLQYFWEQEMYLKLEKCMFSAEEVEYLRMIVGKGGIQMDPVKLKAIWEWSLPATSRPYDPSSDFATSTRSSSPPRSPPPGLHQTVKLLDLGAWLGESLSEPTNCVHQTASSGLPWYLQTLHPHDGCLTDGIRNYTNAAQYQWRHAAMWLSLPDILPCWTQLRHLQLGVACCDPWPQRMEAIPPRILFPHEGSYRP